VSPSSVRIHSGGDEAQRVVAVEEVVAVQGRRQVAAVAVVRGVPVAEPLSGQLGVVPHERVDSIRALGEQIDTMPAASCRSREHRHRVRHHVGDGAVV